MGVRFDLLLSSWIENMRDIHFWWDLSHRKDFLGFVIEDKHEITERIHGIIRIWVFWLCLWLELGLEKCASVVTPQHLNESSFFSFSFLGLGNIESNKSSITNGICCSTTGSKYSKAGRKNSNLSQQDFDKKPLNNNISSNTEHFDGIDEIISAVNTGTLKPKKLNQSKSKDRKKLHGSLPNHLDTDVDYEGSDDTNSSGKCHLAFSLSLTFIVVSRIVN